MNSIKSKGPISTRDEWVLGLLAIYISLMSVPALMGYL